jgi:hypothetical protein
LLIVAVIAAAICLMGVAIRREEKNRTLTHEAPDQLTRAARWLNGAYARAPGPPPTEAVSRDRRPVRLCARGAYGSPCPRTRSPASTVSLQHPEGRSPHAR